MLAKTYSGALLGIHAHLVEVEVNTDQQGEPRIVLLGLPDASVRESVDRVSVALSNAGFTPPSTRTLINLVPGDLRKEGTLYDLPIALALLSAMKALTVAPERGSLEAYLIAGELSLFGHIHPIRGGLPLGKLAKAKQLKGILLPKNAAKEAALVKGLPVYEIESLAQAIEFFKGTLTLEPLKLPPLKPFIHPENRLDFSEVYGQQTVRRAVEIAVAGNHNILLIGPPGCGKA